MASGGPRRLPWLLLIFRLPVRRASQRVEIWRKLKRLGALALPSAGYLLPNTPEHEEQFEWLATAIRRYQGRASVAEVQALDDLPSERLTRLFGEARAKEYSALARELRKGPSAARKSASRLARLRRRFHEIAAIDFFGCPERDPLERMLLGAGGNLARRPVAQARRKQHARKEYRHRVWVTRPRPGIDRAGSAWLIRRYIDPQARFAFAAHPDEHPRAVPFDMFQDRGFRHRGEDCTFETLCKEFGIHDPGVAKLAQMIHDADLKDGKYGRLEGIGLDRALAGWAQTKISDGELLARGMELIEGVYHSVR